MPITTIESQLLKLGHNPVFFTREIGELNRVLSPYETIYGFVDGWIEQLKSEGSSYITNNRVIFLVFDDLNKGIMEDISWADIVKVSTDITEALSEFAFITPFRSICITNIESRCSAKSFLSTIDQLCPEVSRTHRLNTDLRESKVLN